MLFTAKLVCPFVFALANCWFSYVTAHIIKQYAYKVRIEGPGIDAIKIKVQTYAAGGKENT